MTYRLSDFESAPPDARFLVYKRDLLQLAEAAAQKAVERYRSQPKAAEETGALLDLKEASEMLCTSRWTLYSLAERGEIERVKVGGLWKYDKKSIETYLMKSKNQ